MKSMRQRLAGNSNLTKFSTWYFAAVEPRSSGLPNWRVVVWFPLLVLLGAVVLIALHISGTSSGVEWYSLGSGVDPRLIIGSPRAIRSDEWLVQQGWVVSQAANGYPAMSPSFAGGLDMAVLNELPSWDWSSLFRPHLWGYLFFGLDTGIAWHWWIPAVALFIGSYVLVVTIVPRRPMTAALIAVGIFFTPLLQWFYTPSSLWPVAWAFIAIAGVVWTIRDKRLWVRVIWAATIGYTAITMAMGLYIPFMFSGVLSLAAFAIGYVFRSRPWEERGAASFWHRLIPVGVAAIASVGVVGLFAFTHLNAFRSIGGTVYPGTRSVPTGSLRSVDPYLTGFGGAPWNQALKLGNSSILGPNSSEGSSVFLLALFLAAGLSWYAIRSFRKGQRTDWLLVSCIVCLLLVGAYLLVPGWDPIARVLQFDRVPPERFRIFFVILIPLFAALVIEQSEISPPRRNWIPATLSTVVGIFIVVSLWQRIKTLDPAVLAAAPMWFPVSILLLSATFLFFWKGLAPLAALLLLVATVATTGNVNPLYRGIYDLRATKTGQEIHKLDSTSEGAWIGVGSYSTMALLVESGVETFSGVQTYPPKEMWRQIDPTSRYKTVWNRLGHIQWQFGSGEPKLANPTPDVIRGSFDACSSFGQKYVTYVLSDVDASKEPCLRQIERIKQGPDIIRIYEVIRQ